MLGQQWGKLPEPGAVQAGAVLRRIVLDRGTEERVLTLDPERISERELQATLALAPAPRIINLHGSVPLVTMRPFAKFLIAMGYPARTAPQPARRGVFLLELHRQPPARRHARLALRARGHGADADRPQPRRDADAESAAGSRRRLGRPDRGLESAHGRARRPVRHRRSRDRCSATGRRARKFPTRPRSRQGASCACCSASGGCCRGCGAFRTRSASSPASSSSGTRSPVASPGRRRATPTGRRGRPWFAT